MNDDFRLKRIEDKVDKVVEHISSIDVTLAKQHVSLKDHIRRTEILESKLAPVEKHIIMINGILKLIGLMAAVAAIIEVAMKVI